MGGQWNLPLTARAEELVTVEAKKAPSPVGLALNNPLSLVTPPTLMEEWNLLNFTYPVAVAIGINGAVVPTLVRVNLALMLNGLAIWSETQAVTIEEKQPVTINKVIEANGAQAQFQFSNNFINPIRIARGQSLSMSCAITISPHELGVAEYKVFYGMGWSGLWKTIGPFSTIENEPVGGTALVDSIDLSGHRRL